MAATACSARRRGSRGGGEDSRAVASVGGNPAGLGDSRWGGGGGGAGAGEGEGRAAASRRERECRGGGGLRGGGRATGLNLF